MTRLLAESAIIGIVFLAGAGLIDAVGHPVHSTFAKVDYKLPSPAGIEYKEYAAQPPVATHPAKAAPPKRLENVRLEAKEEEPKDDGRIFNNRVKVMWLCLGALGGAWCFFAYNLIKTLNFTTTLNRLKTTCYITVAFISSLFATPWTLIHFGVPTPEETCAFAGFFASIVSWGAIEIVSAVMKKLGLAAEKDGIAGIKKELLGGSDGSQQQNPNS